MIILKGIQHNWYRRIIKKLMHTNQTLSKKEFKFYREIFDNDLRCNAKILKGQKVSVNKISDVLLELVK